MDIKGLIKNLNLTEKEVKVYLSCLEIGESSIILIREKANLPRTTVYHILERLKELGLIEIIETATRRMYLPYPPRKAVTVLRKQETEVKEKIENIQTLLPELNRLYQFSPFQPKVRFYKGEEIKAIYEEILKMPIDEFCYLGETGRLSEIISKRYFANWIPRKVKMGIWTKSLRVRSNEDLFFDPKKDLRKVRYLPQGFKSSVHYYIYGDNVAILASIKENFGIVIISRENALAMRNWFNELWKISAPIISK